MCKTDDVTCSASSSHVFAPLAALDVCFYSRRRMRHLAASRHSPLATRRVSLLGPSPLTMSMSVSVASLAKLIDQMYSIRLRFAFNCVYFYVSDHNQSGSSLCELFFYCFLYLFAGVLGCDQFKRRFQASRSGISQAAPFKPSPVFAHLAEQQQQRQQQPKRWPVLKVLTSPKRMSKRLDFTDLNRRLVTMQLPTMTAAGIAQPDTLCLAKQHSLGNGKYIHH